MQILIHFDEQLLIERYSRKASLLFGIAWHCDGYSYPEENWIDFGRTIIGWWLGVVNNLWQGSQEEEFDFMDGPYSIRAVQNLAKDSIELIPSGSNVIWHVSLIELSTELIRAAKEVCAKLVQMAIGEEDRVTLEQTIDWLESNIHKRAYEEGDNSSGS